MQTAPLFAATALALLASGALWAQTTTETETDMETVEIEDPAEDNLVRDTSPFSTEVLEYGETYLATTLIGTRVYATDQEIDMTAPLSAGTVADWDDIGEIGDLIIGVDGTLQSVVLDVGGFLGIGEREVAIEWSALRGVREDDDPEEYFLGVTLTESQLENAPALERVSPE